MNTQQITVKELREIYMAGTHTIEIDTPDGFQQIGQWFDKGVLDMVTVLTPGYSSTCAVNHMLQLEDLSWVLASELEPGANIITKTGIEPVLSVTPADPAECYDFEVLHKNHRYYGDGLCSHNSGKSYFVSGNIVKDAQRQGIFVVLIDTENALDSDWLTPLGVDVSEDKLLKLNVAMIDDVAKIINDFVKDYRDQYGNMDITERPKVLFVIDSLGMLMTPTETAQFEKGDLKGDMGRKAKALKALVTNCVNMFGDLNIGMVATNHTYASQDIFSPDPVISGGSGFVYASSVVIGMQKRKLKEDSAGNSTSEVNGIRAACKVVKTRYAKPFESVEVKIPYDTGMNPYSGLLEFFEKAGVVVKDGNKLRYTCQDGTEIKEFRKNWTNEHFDRLMDEWETRDITTIIAERQKDDLDMLSE